MSCQRTLVAQCIGVIVSRKARRLELVDFRFAKTCKLRRDWQAERPVIERAIDNRHANSSTVCKLLSCTAKKLPRQNVIWIASINGCAASDIGEVEDDRLEFCCPEVFLKPRCVDAVQNLGTGSGETVGILTCCWRELLCRLKSSCDEILSCVWFQSR